MTRHEAFSSDPRRILARSSGRGRRRLWLCRSGRRAGSARCRGGCAPDREDAGSRRHFDHVRRKRPHGRERGRRLPAPAGDQRGDHAQFRATGARSGDEGDTRLFREACTGLRGHHRSAAGRRQLPFSRHRNVRICQHRSCAGLRRRAQLSLRLELRPHSSRGGRAPVQGDRRQHSLTPDQGHALNARAPIDHRRRRRDPRRHGGMATADRSPSRRGARSFSPAAGSRPMRTCNGSSGRKSPFSMPPTWAIPATAS